MKRFLEFASAGAAAFAWLPLRHRRTKCSSASARVRITKGFSQRLGPLQDHSVRCGSKEVLIDTNARRCARFSTSLWVAALPLAALGWSLATPGFGQVSATSGDGRFTVVWRSEGQESLRPDALGRQVGTLSVKTDDSYMYVFPGYVTVDSFAREGTVSNSNGVLEPGEFVVVETTWGGYAMGGPPIPTVIHGVSGALSSFTGPAGGIYSLGDQSATYAAIYDMGSGNCSDGSAQECYVLSVAAAGGRPSTHWDATVQENLSGGDWPMAADPAVWTLHIGESFPDVPTDNQFYSFIETVLHNGVTAGCFGGGYCPGAAVTRAQMAVFLLKSKFGSAHVPPPCTGTVFTDVSCTGGLFDPWIEELSGLGITGGCGGTLYCPDDAVTREQMAAFLLKTRLGSTYVPPPCAGIFADVPCTPGAGFADWIEDLYNRQITGGCSVAPALYCPTVPNNRGQMAAFLARTFGLVLYGG